MPIVGRFPAAARKKPFSECSWAEIARIGAQGKALGQFAIGDIHPLTLLTGEACQVVILDFNHDDAADGNGKAPLSLGLKDCLETPARMNATLTNSLSWSGSELRASLQTEFWQSLPQDLRAVIKPVKKWTGIGSPATLQQTEDAVWLPAESEIFTINNGFSSPGEGVQYPYFAAANNLRKQRAGKDSTWWERSPATQRADAYCYVTASGGALWYLAHRAIVGVCPCFCV